MFIYSRFSLLRDFLTTYSASFQIVFMEVVEYNIIVEPTDSSA